MQFVKCKECGRHFEEITTSHLHAEHNISLRQYKERHPDAPTMSDERYGKLLYVRTPEMRVGMYERTPDMMTGRWWRTPGHNEENSKSHRGLRHTPETRQKMSKSMLRFCGSPEEHKRKSDFMTERYRDLEEREKTRQAMLLAHSLDPTIGSRIGEGIRWNWAIQPPEVKTQRSLARRGENNPNWRGGYEGKYGYGWRDVAYFIFVRDGWVCQYLDCGKKEDLICHHIDHDTDNWDDSNLITLCRGCNGRVNGSDRLYWQEYFGRRIKSFLGVSNANL